jgi:hypothetical protein
MTNQLCIISALGHEAATEIMEIINASSMLQEHKNAIARNVQAKVKLVPAELAAASALDGDDGMEKQDFHAIPWYIQAHHASGHAFNAAGPSAPLVRLKFIATLFRKVGCNHPTERSMAMGTACAFAEASDYDRMVLQGDTGKFYLDQFKILFRKTPVAVIGREPTVFPPFSEFEAKHPLAHASCGFAPGINRPIFSAADIEKITEIGLAMPLRYSNYSVMQQSTGVGSGAKRLYSPRSRKASNMARDLGNSCSNNDEPYVPGLQIFATPRPTVDRQHSMGPGCLALQGQQQQWAPMGKQQQVPPMSQQLQLPPILDQHLPPMGYAMGQLPPMGQPWPPMSEHQPIGLQPPVGQQPPMQQHSPMDQHLISKGQQHSMAQPPIDKQMGGDGDLDQMINAMKSTRPKTKQALFKKPAAACKKPAAACIKPAGRGKPKGRGICIEWSVKHVLARSGFLKDSGKPGSKAFPYKDEKEIPKCKKLAEKWLRDIGMP